MKSKFIMMTVFIMLILTISLIPIPGLSNTGIDVVSAATTSTTTPEPVVTPEPTVTPKPVVTPEPVITPEPTVTPELVTESIANTPANWAVNTINDAKNIGLNFNNIEEYNRPLTREAFVKLIMNFYSLVSDEPSSVVSSHPYIDTTDAQIIKAYEIGIVKGVDPTTFNPEGLLTREEASVILYRLFKKISPRVDYSLNVQHQFADSVDISSWALESIQFMYDHKILFGTEENTIKPKEFITLEQSVVLFMRTYKDPNFAKQIDENFTTTNLTISDQVDTVSSATNSTENYDDDEYDDDDDDDDYDDDDEYDDD